LVLVHVVVRMADAMPGGGRLRVHLTRPTGPPECLSICFHGARDSLGSGARRLGASSQYAARSGIATPALQNLMGRFQGEIADDGGPGSEHYVNLTLRSANLDAQPPDTALVRAA
jgi:hypothetical protein